MRAAVKVAVAFAVIMGAAYLFVFPMRTYLGQKEAIASERQTVAVLARENAALSAEKAALGTKATIEQIAREEYGLVMPGQQAFMVLPSPAKTVPVRPGPRRQGHWYAPLELWRYL